MQDIHICYSQFQSTHSRGVRLPRLTYQALVELFQSTHSRGVRLNSEIHIDLSRCFNPRTHEECDQRSRYDQPGAVHVSIHALTRSATKELYTRFIPVEFQSTHSRGVRRSNSLFCCSIKFVSIHALTRSATFHCRRNTEEGRSFNPRTHEECDSNIPAAHRFYLVSIHALTRSATNGLAKVAEQYLKFQSTHSRGVRRNRTGYKC